MKELLAAIARLPSGAQPPVMPAALNKAPVPHQHEEVDGTTTGTTTVAAPTGKRNVKSMLIERLAQARKAGTMTEADDPTALPYSRQGVLNAQVGDLGSLEGGGPWLGRVGVGAVRSCA